MKSDIIVDYININEGKIANSKFNYKNMRNLEIKLLGKHQAVAVEPRNKGYKITDKNIGSA